MNTNEHKADSFHGQIVKTLTVKPAEAARQKALHELEEFLQPFKAVAKPGDVHLLIWVLREWENRRNMPGYSKEQLADAMAAALGIVPDYMDLSDAVITGVQ